MEQLNDLELLIDSRYPIIAIDTVEEERVERTLRRVAARLEIPLFVWSVTRGLVRQGADAPIYDTVQPGKALANLSSMEGAGLYYFKDLQRYLDDAAVVRGLRDLSEPFSRDRRAVVLSGSGIEMPPTLDVVTAHFRLRLPDEDELRALARRTIDALNRNHDIDVRLDREAFDRLVREMLGLTAFEAERLLTRAILADLALTAADVDHVTELKVERLEREGLLEYLPAEEGLDEIGGLDALKAWLRKRRGTFGEEARGFGLAPPKGIILLGVQGCGKTLAAKAVAVDWRMPLLRMEPGRLYDKYIGESDKNLARALATAERMAPCVLMIDEIEKGFAAVGSADADAGLSRRIFGRLLGWLQDRDAPVFVVATCNRIAELPPELMRKGRFDEVFFVDLPDAGERREIFEVHLRKRDRDPAGFDLDALVEAAEGFSGAEIEQAVVSALYTAFSEGGSLADRHLLEELRSTRPLSVTRAEEVRALREWARGRTVMAG